MENEQELFMKRGTKYRLLSACKSVITVGVKPKKRKKKMMPEFCITNIKLTNIQVRRFSINLWTQFTAEIKITRRL